ncbi:hypothetical protein B0H14DRAFT_3130239 [Mycena olivaceomarginata]|nr:hypothetical protein B0H14DRAFT_3130239 [Mycena olivaceomarginata]
MASKKRKRADLHVQAPGSSPKGNSEVRGFQGENLRFLTPELGGLRPKFWKPTPMSDHTNQVGPQWMALSQKRTRPKITVPGAAAGKKIEKARKNQEKTIFTGSGTGKSKKVRGFEAHLTDFWRSYLGLASQGLHVRHRRVSSPSRDEQEAAQIEESAVNLGYGPLTDCSESIIVNCSQQKAYCPSPHRDNKNNLVQPLMKRLPCTSKFRVLEPKQEFRTARPFILIVTHGPHPHPVAFPTKTPPKIRVQIFDLLGKLAEDLPDITPRRFIQHSIVQSYLASKSPLLVSPTLADWHVSLSNRSHIRAYIKQAIELVCPFGTGWASWGLNSTQSDIAFTRIAMFLEFELACMDRDANTTAAHQRVFEEIRKDTGKALKWRHLHGTGLDAGYGDMVLSYTYLPTWTADQHRGQVKGGEVQFVDRNTSSIQLLGLGLHLQKIVSNVPLKPDLHQPERKIQDLNPYEHLARVFRACIIHDFRNIKKCAVSEEVRWLMRSLVCIENDDWDGTLTSIREKRGKAGNDWVKDKESSQFFFPESAGSAVSSRWTYGMPRTQIQISLNQEGVHCTLLGGLQKARRFDALKMKTLITYENYGIIEPATYPRICITINLKRKANSQHNVLAVEDQKIERYNEKLLKSLDNLAKAENAVYAKQRKLVEERRPEKRQKIEGELEKKQRAEERARKAFEKQHAEKNSLKGGSGKVARKELIGPTTSLWDTPEFNSFGSPDSTELASSHESTRAQLQGGLGSAVGALLESGTEVTDTCGRNVGREKGRGPTTLYDYVRCPSPRATARARICAVELEQQPAPLRLVRQRALAPVVRLRRANDVLNPGFPPCARPRYRHSPCTRCAEAQIQLAEAKMDKSCKLQKSSSSCIRNWRDNESATAQVEQIRGENQADIERRQGESSGKVRLDECTVYSSADSCRWARSTGAAVPLPARTPAATLSPTGVAPAPSSSSPLPSLPLSVPATPQPQQPQTVVPVIVVGLQSITLGAGVGATAVLDLN